MPSRLPLRDRDFDDAFIFLIRLFLPLRSSRSLFIRNYVTQYFKLLVYVVVGIM